MFQVLKAVVAKYNAEELLSKRESVSNRIREELTERAKQFHLIMDDVSITHLTFGHEFTKAIENKQVSIWNENGVCSQRVDPSILSRDWGRGLSEQALGTNAHWKVGARYSFRV